MTTGLRAAGDQKGRRAARTMHEPELVIDTDRETVTRAAANGTS